MSLPCAKAPPSSPPRDSSVDWFSQIFGFAESAIGLSSSMSLRVCEGTLPKIQSVTGSWSCGTFATPSVSELRESVNEHENFSELAGKLQINVICGDVVDFMGDSANRFCTIQVASQFNCLEMIDARVRPEDGITRYAHDKSQGPACAVACAPGAVLRNYYVKVDDDCNVL